MNFLPKIVAFFYLLALPSLLFCQKMPAKDSLYKLNFRDTILVRQSATKELVFLHKVAKKQTLFSISAFYGLSIDEIIRLNPSLSEGKGLAINQLLSISMPIAAMKKYKDKNFRRWHYCAVYFPYSKKESLYHVAHDIFSVSVDSVTFWNKLSKNLELAEGQLLQVGWLPTTGIPDSLRKAVKRDTNEAIKKLIGRVDKLKEKFEKDNAGNKLITEQGVAFWQRSGGQNTDLYALHRFAPINSVIAVTNPMKRRTMYVKVIDKLPENVYGEDVKVVLSPAVARLLGARDPRFFVKIKYKK